MKSHNTFVFLKYIVFALLSCSYILYGQIPSQYYAPAYNKSGNELKTALSQIITAGHTSNTYSSLWTSFQSTDKRSDGKVWDIYSNCTFTFGTDQDGGQDAQKECIKYNREHSIPNSWFGGEKYPMYADLFHLYPVDKYVNAERANYPYGETTNPVKTYGNGSKRGNGTSESGYTGMIFEPIDEYKGDLARTYFYMATRYLNVDFQQDGQNLGKITFTYTNSTCNLTTYAIKLFVDWHRQDPVSNKETNRNNAVYSIQHNRNPFIDYPELVELIWGADIGTPFLPEVSVDEISENESVTIYPNPTNGELKVMSYELRVMSVEVLDIFGRNVSHLISHISCLETDISHLPTGVYFVRITTENQSYIYKKIIKY